MGTQAAALMVKRMILKVVSVTGGIAGAIFLFMPLGTFTQLLLCVGSLAVAFVCFAILRSLDDENTGDSGYWPNKPSS
jgi:hypothetical protein